MTSTERKLVYVVLVFAIALMTVAVYYNSTKEEGERKQVDCHESKGNTSCEVWEKTADGWKLCYKDVPKDIPPEDILCR